MQMTQSLGYEELNNNLMHRLAPCTGELDMHRLATYAGGLDKNSPLCDH